MPKQFTPKPAAEFENFRLADHIGSTVAITVQDVTTVDTKFGEREAIKADVTIVDGLQAGRDFGNVLLFDAAVVADLRDDDGAEPTVAKVATYMARGKECIKLVAPTADAWDAAQALYVSSPANPAPSSEIPF